jgi:thymidylate synthase
MNESSYLELLRNVLENGQERTDRTGTGTRSIFAPNSLRFDLTSDTLPLLTTKRVPFKAVVEELLWFLRGDTDAKVLQEKGVKIWDGNSSRDFLDSRGLKDYPTGVLGKVYGFQWRHFGAEYKVEYADSRNIPKGVHIGGFDQIKYVENLIKNDPHSRRIYMSTWNSADLDQMALPPCHLSAQFYVDSNSELSCHMYQRSVDLFLGLPFNIASYAVLTNILAKKCGLKPKELILSFGDAHIYNNHILQVQEQLTRLPKKFPTIILDDSVIDKDYDLLELKDFSVIDYTSHPKIIAKMAI